MYKLCDLVYYYFLSKVRNKIIERNGIRNYLKDRCLINNSKVQSAEQINQYIGELIESGKPFMAGRFGANELSAMKTFDFGVKSKYKIALKYLSEGAGFFPQDVEYAKHFTELMIESVAEADVMGIWMLPFEDYYLRLYGEKTLRTTYLLDLEPWSAFDMPWSAALKKKNVLVIHPFAETIKAQYSRREKIFPNSNVLPEFNLLTIKAVQTIAGEKDNRFNNWFEALQWMYDEAMKQPFDIAIIGCGAYGFPLAAMLKKAGKQAIHLAGATQLLFGIKGKRWENNNTFSYVQKFFNESWVYPADIDRPQYANKVEGGCYW